MFIELGPIFNKTSVGHPLNTQEREQARFFCPYFFTCAVFFHFTPTTRYEKSDRHKKIASPPISTMNSTEF